MKKLKIFMIMLAFIFMGAALPAASVMAAEEGTLENGIYKQTFDGTSTRADIQEALDYTRDGLAEKVEITLKGTVSIDGCLYVYSNTTINAAGATIKATQGNGSLLASATGRKFEGTYAKGYKTTENITINGGTWNGDKKIGQVMRFVHSTNVTIDGVTVSNCTDTGHLISLEGVNRAVIKNSTLQGYSGMGKAKEALHLDIVHNETTTPDLLPAEYDDLPNRNITITNNTIKNAPNGIGSHGAVEGVYHQNIVITKNTITGASGAAVKAFNYKKLTISENKISDVSNGIKVYTNVGGEDAENGEDVYYKPNKGAATEGVPANNNYEISITKNILKNIKKGTAIQVQGSKTKVMNGVVVENNTIDAVSYKGIWLLAYCQNALVKGNTISNTKSSGIDVRTYCNGSVIENNIVNTPKEAGIAIMNNISNVTVKKNTVNNSKYHGIWVYTKANNVTVTENIVNNVTKSGIYVSNNSSKVKVSKNTIKGTIKQNGIYINKSTSPVVENNTIGNVGKNGIYIDNSSNSAKVKNNKIGVAKLQGILVYKSSGSELSKNTIKQAKGHGIQISNSKKASKVVGNTIQKAGQNGIHIYDATKTTVSGNTVKNVGNRGISINIKSSNSKILKNTITNVKAEGVSVYSVSNITVQNNTLSKIGTTGINIGEGGNTVKVTGNTLENVSGEGIAVWNSKKATITGNELEEIKERAIRVSGVSANVGTVDMPAVDKVSKSKKIVSGTAKAKATYTVTVGGKNYKATVKKGTFKTKKISAIKAKASIRVTETVAGKNKLVITVKAK